jgi:peptide/nickel transport system permease protein
MLSFLVRKVPSVMLVLFVSSILAFALPRFAPGDVAAVLAGPDPTPEAVAAIRQELGLDEPLVTQYLSWMGGMFTGDLGESYVFRRSVSSLVGDRLESTLELAVASIILTLIVGMTLGVLGGSVRMPWVRGALDLINGAMVAIPSFLVGLGLILVFGIMNRWLPVSGQVSVLENPVIGIQYLILPAVALSLASAAVKARMVQTEMLRVRKEDYVDLALGKGASSRRITFRHVLPNSLGAAVVALGLQVGNVLAGAVIVESIFARNGLGQLAVSSATSRDFPVLQVLILAAVFTAVICQLLTEVALAALDPRIRLDS